MREQEYAMHLLQMLQDYGDDFIQVDTVIIIVKLLAKLHIENAVFFATGDSYTLGAMEFDDPTSARYFIDQLSEKVLYATILDGEFRVYQYPYRSRVMDEWVFVEMALQMT